MCGFILFSTLRANLVNDVRIIIIIIIWPTDFKKFAWGPMLGPPGGQKWIPREMSCRSQLSFEFSMGF